MPRFPDVSRLVDLARRQVFDGLGDALAQRRAQGDLIELHLGDTHWNPPEAALRMAQEEHSHHTYGPVEGLPGLRSATLARLARMSGRDLADRALLVTVGATGGIHVAARVCLDAGDEVLVLTPTWPLIFGILRAMGLSVRQVPVSASGWPGNAESLGALVEQHVTAKTAAMYFCQPNNPVGYVFDPAQLDALAKVAKRHGLWVMADEAYMDLVFAGVHHSSLAHFPAEHLLMVGTYSKSLAMAGHRVGYVCAPEALGARLGGQIAHTTYQASTWSQAVVLAALPHADAHVDRSLVKTRERARRATLELGVSPEPRAGMFAFFPIPEHDQTPETFFLRCIEHGVSLAPGRIFGAGFERFARLCFTVTSDDALDLALERVNAAKVSR